MLLCNMSFAQQLPSDFKVALADQALIKVLRRYISVEQSHGITKGRTVLVMTSSSILGNPDKDEWILGATNLEKSLRYQVPAFVGEVDGYPVVFNFPGHLDKYIKCSDAYLAFLEKYVFSRLKQDFSQTSNNSFSGWLITFSKGKEPDIKALL